MYIIYSSLMCLFVDKFFVNNNFHFLGQIFNHSFSFSRKSHAKSFILVICQFIHFLSQKKSPLSFQFSILEKILKKSSLLNLWYLYHEPCRWLLQWLIWPRSSSKLVNRQHTIKKQTTRRRPGKVALQEISEQY